MKDLSFSICVSIDAVSSHAVSITIVVSGTWAFHCYFQPIWHYSSQTHLKQGTCGTSLHPTKQPPSYVREGISNFIQPSSSLIVLCHNCNGTHLMPNVFEFISQTHPYSEGGLFDIILVVYLTTNHLWCHEINTKHLFNYTIVGTILFHHYFFGVEVVIFLCYLAKNLIKQLPEQTNFMC